MHPYRTHNCRALRKADVGKTVRLSGWVHRVRDHGGLLFIDLRDHYGVTQVVVEPDSPKFAEVAKVRSEWVITVTGPVVARSEDTVNMDLPTGEIEIRIEEFAVQGRAGELPLPVFGEPDYPEDVRLRYRFLDLRRESLHRNIVLRSEIIQSIRKRMVEEGFREYQTPILTASSPEGARDFLVPSRLHPGKFYALPQAPQQFKQLIMVAGFDRYFQIAPCFRDEDARADRSPGEFYQLDVEMSFVTQEDVFAALSPVLHDVFCEFANGRSVSPLRTYTRADGSEYKSFKLIGYAEAMSKYGSDKPDLRNPIEMADVSHIFRGSGFKIFANMLEKDSKVRVWAIPGPAGGNRAFCDRMNSWAQGEGQPGLGYIFWRSESGTTEGAGPIAKNIGPERTERLRGELGLKEGDAVFFVAGAPKKFVSFAGAARQKIGQELTLKSDPYYEFDFCWVVDFPMYEWNEEEKRIDFSHNPFSMPNYSPESFLELDPKSADDILDITAFQYDIVCSGVELSSGAIRNHRPDVMLKAFEIAGYAPAETEAQFSGMLNALRYGAPPHGGTAPGIDRIVMLIAGEENLREVTMFPMNQRAEDLMMGAPSQASSKQLRELHLRVIQTDKEQG
jgi:aspartyl-tRNA synthetase